MHVTAIDINPIASEICQLNALVNGISEDLTILTGSLYNALNNIESSCSYELITVNPPLLPIPEDVPYPSLAMAAQMASTSQARLFEVQEINSLIADISLQLE